MDHQSSAMPFFGKSQKSPAEIVRSLKENVAYMEKLDAADSKKCEKVSTVSSFYRLIILVWLLFIHFYYNRSWSESLTVLSRFRLQRRHPKIWLH